MADKNVYVHLQMNDQSIKRGGWERLAAAPATNLFDGRQYYDTVLKRVGWYDAGAAAWKYTLHADDLNAFGAWQGNHDASGGGVPATGSGPAGAVAAGDMWVISVAGTIAGLASGSTTLAVGDILVASSDTAAPVAGDFVAIERNADLSSAGVVESNVIASIPAATPTALGISLTTLYSVQAFDATGN